MDARLIVDPPAAGEWNMAADELLFQTAIEQRRGALRLYAWSPATLSLGYFQPQAGRELHRPSRPLPLVRRTTGGGAIVHDQELTYSLALPLQQDRAHAARAVLASVHQSLVDLFAEMDIPLQRLASPPPPGDRREPFLCFQRRAPDDLLLGNHKVGGSAQRRQHAALLQHGSILLRQSSAAPELPGIEDISQRTGIGGWLIENWPSRLSQALHLELVPSGWSDEEREAIFRIAQDKFSTRRWNAKR